MRTRYTVRTWGDKRLAEPIRELTISPEQRNYLEWFNAQNWRDVPAAESNYHYRQYCLIFGEDPGPNPKERTCQP